MPAKCPHCSTQLVSIRVEGIEAAEPSGTKHQTALFVCPVATCGKILGASFNLSAQSVHIVQKINALLDNQSRNDNQQLVQDIKRMLDNLN